MEYVSFHELNASVSGAEAREQTVQYLKDRMVPFLKRNDRMLICFQKKGPGSFGALLEEAAYRIGALPLVWGPDFRWKELLRQAFISHACVIAAPPLIVLGLTKLARATQTPLYIRNAITAGYPCLDWMIDGIRAGLDCQSWGCFGPGTGAVVSGFSCGRSRGVHLREDAFSLEIVDDAGNALPEGALGEVVLWPKNAPELRLRIPERGRLDFSPCPCGSKAPRLMGICLGRDMDPTLEALGEQIQSWSSVLDCRLEMGPHGLEIEIVTFPGEMLPKLPSCAKLVVRPWDPERDTPFWLDGSWKNNGFYGESH